MTPAADDAKEGAELVAAPESGFGRGDRICELSAWTVSLPLARPVVFGSLRYDARDYTVVRIRDGAGGEGAAWGMARGAPLTETVAVLGRLVVGEDPCLTEALWQRMYGASIPFGQRGLALRALSLIDIALWDLRARRAGLPLWRLLGGARDSMLASVGGGYYREGRERDEISAELEGYVASGFRHVKIPGGGLPPEEEGSWVELAREAVGPGVELAVDAHWTWQDAHSAARVLKGWEPARLAWVEDPLPPEAAAAHATLRQNVSVPIAVGDEQSGRWAYQNLLLAGAADIWRLDVTTVGGFSEARRVAAIASTWGIPLSTHVYAELHVHLGAAEAGVMAVEYTDPAADIDLCHRFLDPIVTPREGMIAAPTAPGLGVEVDWELVQREATSSAQLA
jgi:L-alanine-DL-glutamate epimerase-like enolase superfamily enzyme